MGKFKKQKNRLLNLGAFSFLVFLDLLGVVSTAEKGASLYSQSKTIESKEFKILEQNEGIAITHKRKEGKHCKRYETKQKNGGTIQRTRK